jgi:hypothetical protein
VVKQAQHPVAVACNDPLWFAAAAGKLTFQIAMKGAWLPASELLAVIQGGR